MNFFYFFFLSKFKKFIRDGMFFEYYFKSLNLKKFFLLKKFYFLDLFFINILFSKFFTFFKKITYIISKN